MSCGSLVVWLSVVVWLLFGCCFVVASWFSTQIRLLKFCCFVVVLLLFCRCPDFYITCSFCCRCIVASWFLRNLFFASTYVILPNYFLLLAPVIVRGPSFWFATQAHLAMPCRVRDGNAGKIILLTTKFETPARKTLAYDRKLSTRWYSCHSTKRLICEGCSTKFIGNSTNSLSKPPPPLPTNIAIITLWQKAAFVANFDPHAHILTSHRFCVRLYWY